MNKTFNATKYDFLIISCILLVSAASFILFKLLSNSNNNVLILHHNKKIVGKYNMLKNNKYKIKIDNELLCSIEINNGKAKIIETSCPKKICKNFGYIKYAGQSIICVPNKLFLKIENSKSSKIDAITY
ncbi:NusG domain II-containing protein [bacterium]